MTTNKDWILVTPKIEYEDTRFRFVGKAGDQKIPCYNMTVEKFMRIVELRKLTELKAIVYWWDYEAGISAHGSGGWPQRMELAIVIDHRVPLAYRPPCPDLWTDDHRAIPPTDIYWDMIEECHKERFP